MQWKISSIQQSHISELTQRWALKKTKEAVSFSEKQRSFLLENFDKGIQKRKKFSPEDIVKEMRKNPSFEKGEFLSTQQIASFWSREAAKRRGDPTTTSSRPVSADDNDFPVDDDYLRDSNIADVETDIREELEQSECFDNSR